MHEKRIGREHAGIDAYGACEHGCCDRPVKTPLAQAIFRYWCIAHIKRHSGTYLAIGGVLMYTLTMSAMVVML